MAIIFNPHLVRGCRRQQDAVGNVVFPGGFIKNPSLRSVFDVCTQIQFLDECHLEVTF